VVTADPTTSALHRLEAERLRPTPSRDEPVRPIRNRDETPADPWQELIAALDRLLTDPGPPDSILLSPGPPRPIKITTPTPKETQ
jgi:hypothetical protein